VMRWNYFNGELFNLRGRKLMKLWQK